MTDFPFVKDPDIAEQDKEVFSRWAGGMLNTDQAIEELKLNNGAPNYHLSEGEFTALAFSLGWCSI